MVIIMSIPIIIIIVISVIVMITTFIGIIFIIVIIIIVIITITISITIIIFLIVSEGLHGGEGAGTAAKPLLGFALFFSLYASDVTGLYACYAQAMQHCSQQMMP